MIFLEYIILRKTNLYRWNTERFRLFNEIGLLAKRRKLKVNIIIPLVDFRQLKMIISNYITNGLPHIVTKLLILYPVNYKLM